MLDTLANWTVYNFKKFYTAAYADDLYGILSQVYIWVWISMCSSLCGIVGVLC